jgi:adenylate kinase
MRILILGPQGSGKGTQAKRIAEHYGVPHIATGDMFRAAVAEGSELGRRVAPILEEGGLVPDDLTIEIIRERLADEDGFVLDGFPRTMAQAEALDSMLEEIGKPLDAVLLLQVSDEVATARLRERAVQEGRADDSPEAIETRLRLYHELTELVVDRYQHAGIEVAVDGEQPVDEGFAAFQDALEGVVARSCSSARARARSRRLPPPARSSPRR